MLINNKYEYAPCVKKVWAEEAKKRDASPRHKEFMVWVFKNKKSMDKSAKSIVKIFSQKDISHLEKGKSSQFIGSEFSTEHYFIRLEFYTRNPFPLLDKLKMDSMVGGYGMSKMYEAPKDKTNYITLYKKTLSEIRKEIEKLKKHEIKNFGKNMKLRDALIKRIKIKSTYHVSTIDSWIIDEVEKFKIKT